MKVRIGVDIGGTFTDVAVLTQDGFTHVFKTPSTPNAPEVGVMHGIATALQRIGVSPANCEEFVVSATVGVNAVIERKGAPVGLLVTAGFEDILELGRVKMRNVFSLDEVRRPPLVRKEWVRGINERMVSAGEIAHPLDEAQLLRSARELVAQGVQSLAVIFLHSYRNPAHELAAKSILEKAFPHIPIAISSELWPQIREYERATVLVMNSYIAPKVQHYIEAISAKKVGIGLSCPLYISASNGGLVPAAHASLHPITTLLSGPSAGVVAAINLMRNSGVDRAITFDMGGTSADICVLEGEEIPYACGQEIEGLPIATPYVDISAIGSGGGSLAHVDNVGLLHVGPESAGSSPGPAAYGRGGTRPTLTDAYLVSGYIDPAHVIGGELSLSLEKARDAIRQLAEQMHRSIEETAAGIIRITTSIQVAEFSRIAAKRGIDVRDFVLVPFGGAGPTHACLLADELRLRRISIPASPGIFCALGSVLADFRLDYIKTVYAALDQIDEENIEKWYADITEDGREALRDVGDESAYTLAVKRVVDVRYRGQGFEVALSFDRLEHIPELFRREYRKLYGPRHDEAGVEIISFRASVIGLKKNSPQRWVPISPQVGAAGQRSVFLKDTPQDIAVYRRERMPIGWKGEGPFLVDQEDTTCLVTPGWHATVDAIGTLQLTKDQANA